MELLSKIVSQTTCELSSSCCQGRVLLTSLALQEESGQEREFWRSVAEQVAAPWSPAHALPPAGWHSHVGVIFACPGTPPIHPALSPTICVLRTHTQILLMHHPLLPHAAPSTKPHRHGMKCDSALIYHGQSVCKVPSLRML